MIDAKIDRPTHIVVMGDLIGSEKAASVDVLHRVFNTAVDSINDQYSAALVSPLTITLGDEFQGLCPSLTDGMAIVRAVRQRLLADAVPCRFVLGSVTLRTPPNHNRAWNMMGPGLADARARLSDKRDPNAYRYSLPDQPVVAGLLDALGHTLTSIEQDWTDRQLQIVSALFDDDRSVADLADRLGVTGRNIYKVRTAANFELYQTVWQSTARALHALDEEFGFVSC